jgi:predicted small secreted protein
MKLTETEKNRMRDLHYKHSVVKENINEQVEMTDIEIPEGCLKCVKAALKGTGNIFGVDISYDYSTLALQVGAKLFTMYAEGIEEVDMKDMEELFEMMEDVNPVHIALIGPKLLTCGSKCAVESAIDYTLGVD